MEVKADAETVEGDVEVERTVSGLVRDFIERGATHRYENVGWVNVSCHSRDVRPICCLFDYACTSDVLKVLLGSV